jgi:fructose-1-phosphate kinase PfkB-like protein
MHAIVHEARQLTAQIPFIAVSSVERGALLVSKTKAWFARGPRVAVKSSVGAGDAMVGAMAGVIYAHVRAIGKAIPIEALADHINADGPAILRSGLAAALATLSKYGTRLGSRHAIHMLSKKVQVEEV